MVNICKNFIFIRAYAGAEMAKFDGIWNICCPSHTHSLQYTHTLTHTTILRIYEICPGQPG